VKDLWGDRGASELREHLPPQARRVICEEIVLPVAWYPETYFESCCDVVWRRLAREDEGAFFAFIHRSVDSGWTIVHRALMRLATPQRLARRAPDLWRHDHTHGELFVDLHESHGTIRVRGYPYGPHSIVRRGQTEALRYILAHARVRDVRATPQDDADGDFLVLFEWT
jgi:hypothetical protein